MTSPVPEIFTVGHSTRNLDEFAVLLGSSEIRCVVDVRAAPRSRRMPHFAKESLEQALPEQRIDYVHVKELGGWRRPVAGSPNGGWHSLAFQGYADHMATPEFEAAIERVTEVAAGTRVALMCAEAVWWRCHRMLISDFLTLRGWRVRHIGTGAAAEDHRLTPFALLDGRRVTYPPAQKALWGTLQQQADSTA